MKQKSQTYLQEVEHYGIESISRGAKNAISCDNSRKAIEIVKRNVQKTHFEDKIEIIQKDYKKALSELAQRKFDIIFLDPPYKTDFGANAIKFIIEKSILKNKGIIVFETDREEKYIDSVCKMAEVIDIRKYGRVKLIFLRSKGENQLMEIFTLLETLEEIIENGKKLPFSNKGIVDKEEFLDLIKEIRIKLPEELKQAKWVKEERTRILIEAQKEADDIVKEAENRIIAMIDEHEITRKAYAQKAEIIETANEMAREISNGTKEHADALLGNIEAVLEETLKTIQNNRKELK